MRSGVTTSAFFRTNRFEDIADEDWSRFSINVLSGCGLARLCLPGYEARPNWGPHHLHLERQRLQHPAEMIPYATQDGATRGGAGAGRNRWSHRHHGQPRPTRPTNPRRCIYFVGALANADGPSFEA